MRGKPGFYVFGFQIDDAAVMTGSGDIRRRYILRWAGPFRLLPSPGLGDPKTRLRVAFRIFRRRVVKSVVTSL